MSCFLEDASLSSINEPSVVLSAESTFYGFALECDLDAPFDSRLYFYNRCLFSSSAFIIEDSFMIEIFQLVSIKTSPNCPIP